MTKETAKEIFLNRGFINGLFDGDKWRQCIVVISEWLKQESCEDYISRQSVLKYIEGSEADLGHDSENELVCQDIKAFPPVNPQPKTDVLKKIRSEIHATAEMHEDGDYYLRDEWIDEIIDKYKTEK